MLGTIIVPFTEKVFGDHNYEVLTSSRNGIQRQSEHFAGKQRHDTDGYNIIPRGYCTYRNRSDDGLFTFNMNNIVDEGIVSKFYPVFTFQNANSTFMMEYLNGSPRVRAKLSVLAVGTSQVVLSFETLKETSFYLPIFEEQNRIASLLSALNARIEKQRLLIEHLKKYKRGAITLILSNKDGSWKSGRLGDFITINRGGSPRPIEAFITNDPDGVNWIKIGDVSEESLYITQTAEKITAEGSRKSRKVFAGDLILSNSMSFGRPYIMQIEGCIHDGWLLLRDDGACFDKKYLCYYLASDEVLAQYKKYAAGSCVSNLNSELVSNVFIEFPPLEKQKEIASSLELLDERINCEIKLLEKLLLIKKGLLQSLFI